MTRARYVSNPQAIDIPLTVSANLTANAVITVGNSSVNSVITSNTYSIGSNVSLNTSRLFLGNSTVNSVHTASTLDVGSNVNLSTVGINIGSNTVNAYVNSTSFAIGNSTVNTAITSTTITSTALLSIGNTNVTGTANVSTGINVGANVNLSTSQINVGNSTVNTVITNITVSTNTVNVSSIINVGANVNLSTSQINVGNSTVNTVISSSALTTTSNTATFGTAVYIAANGNVGVGTNSPTRKLYIQSDDSGAGGNVLAIRNANTTAGAFINFLGGGGSAPSIGVKNNDIVFTADLYSGTELMRLNSTGNLGIGTTSPANRLTVATGTEASGQAAIAGFRTASTTASYNAGLEIYATASATATSRQVLAVWDADGANSSGGDYFIIQKNGNSGATDILNYSNAAIRFGTNYTNRVSYDMTLDSSGNLGIGTSSPQAKVHVSNGSTQNIEINPTYIQSFNRGGSPGYADLNLYASNFIFYNGNIGFGAVPTVQNSLYRAINLDVNNFYSIVGHNASACEGNLIWNAYSTGNETFAYKGGGDQATRFRQAGTFRWEVAGVGTAGNTVSFVQAMVLDNNGNMCLGNSSPSARLTLIAEAGGQPMIQMRNFNTNATGAFLGTYATELRSASTGSTVHGARIHLNESNDDRRTLDIADQNGIIATFVNGKVGIGTTTPTNTLLWVNGNWTSGHSTVKISTPTSFAGGGTTGIGLYDSDGTRSSIFYQASTGTYIGTEVNKPFYLYANGSTRITIAAVGDVYFNTRQLFATQQGTFSIGSGGSYVFNLEAAAGLFSTGLLYVLGRENSLNQTLAVYSFNISYISGTRYLRLIQISRNTLNNGYGDVYAYVSTYSGSYTSNDQSISGTSSAVSDIYFRNAVGAACVANYSIYVAAGG